MRLFIAIDFSELKNYFINLQKLLPDAKLSPAKSFHITLKFLGEVLPDKIDVVIEKLKMIKFSHFNVFLDAIGVFPSENSIRVVWVGVKPEEKILELQKQVDDALFQLFRKEKDFKAHVTLARIKYIDDKKGFLERLRNVKVDAKKTEVNGFKLIKSALTQKGAVYEDLAVFNSQ